MITEIFNDPNKPIKLDYHYITNYVLDIVVEKSDHSWSFDLKPKKLSQTIEKRSASQLFEPIVENPRCFKYTLNGVDIAYLQLGHQTWNNRMRVWDFLIDPNARRSGIGTKLMNLAKQQAKEVGARMLVLETQNCNIPAINFYLKHGFQLIGFDLAHYTNDDIRRHEFKLEFGFYLN